LVPNHGALIFLAIKRISIMLKPRLPLEAVRILRKKKIIKNKKTYNRKENQKIIQKEVESG
jgi:hypothetical protein